MRALLVYLAVAVVAVPASAQLDHEPTAEDDAARQGGRDAIRLRAGMTVGSALQYSDVTYPVWQRAITGRDEWGSPTYGRWVEVGSTGSQRYGVSYAFVSLQLGIQTDLLAGYVLARVAFGAPALLHQTYALVAEVTLADLLQVGIGPSLDITHVRRDSDVRSTLGTSVERYVGLRDPNFFVHSYEDDWSVAPGLEVRLGFATGGGPYERRGFVIVPFFHLTVPSDGIIILTGIEIGLQTY